MFVINLKSIDRYNAIDDRMGAAIFFHELVHSLYATAFLESGNRLACRYQEDLAWDATVRMMRLFDKFDRQFPTEIFDRHQAIYSAHGKPQAWKAVIEKYCAGRP